MGESCRRQVESLRKELEEVTNVAESKTRECIALVDAREWLARELENAEIDIRKLGSRVGRDHTSQKVIQRKLEAINAQSPFIRPSNFYELLYLTQGAATSTIQKYFKMLAMLCHPDKGGTGSTVLKKQRNIWTLKWTFETLAFEWVKHSNFLRGTQGIEP